MELTPLSTTWWLQAEIKSATSHHLAQLKEKGLGKICSATIAETNENSTALTPETIYMWISII